MPVAASFDDLIVQGKGELQTLRPDLLVQDGDMTEADLHAGAAMVDAGIRYSAQCFRDTFFDGAVGDALTALVRDRTLIERDPATPSQVDLRLSRSNGTNALTIPVGSQFATEYDESGKRIVFETINDVEFSAGGDLGPYYVVANATENGVETNVPANSVVVVVTSFVEPVQVDNPNPSGGGNEEQSDESLRVEARTFYQTLRRGTLAALEYGARTVPSVRIARAVEDEDTALVTLLVTDEDGNSTAQMVADTMLAIVEWRVAGPNVSVIGGVALEVGLQIAVRARTGFDVDAVSDILVESVISRIRKFRPGETLYLDTLIAAVIAMYPDDLLDVAFLAVTVDGVPQPTAPADIVPASLGQKVKPGTITVEVMA